MSYQDKKSQNFAQYCGEGKQKLVDKWIDNPNVDINWNFSSPLKHAIKNNQVAILKQLLDHPNLKLPWKRTIAQFNGISYYHDPMAHAINTEDLNLIKIIVDDGRLPYKDTNVLNWIMKNENQEVIDYFLGLDGMNDYIMEQAQEDERFFELMPKEVRELFVF